MSRGRFITLEGIEGAGKSTVAQLAREWLTARRIPVRVTREPGGTPIAERLRQVVLERGEELIPPVAETLIMFAARAQHIVNVIRPALARGEWVICDRFTDATRAYQGGGRGVDAQLIESLARAVHGDLTIDCTLLLDLPVAAGLSRARARLGDAAQDRFEAETLAFHERVRARYLALLDEEPERVQLIDATAPLAEVRRQLEAVLASLAPVRR
ncbi:MAG TPA: dTMP kinase [Steroidobacteraceae bacterium]|nr:dTMP kinase [Steroidobacteraceae bacterium]